MSTEIAAAVHPWDEGAQAPSNRQLIISAVIAWFWLGLGPTPLLPIGLLINLFRLGGLTGANTWGGRFRFGRKVLLISAAAAAVGFLMKAGLFLSKGSVSFHLF